MIENTAATESHSPSTTTNNTEGGAKKVKKERKKRELLPVKPETDATIAIKNQITELQRLLEGKHLVVQQEGAACLAPPKRQKRPYNPDAVVGKPAYDPNEGKRRNNFGPLTSTLAKKWGEIPIEERSEVARKAFMALSPEAKAAYRRKLEARYNKAVERRRAAAERKGLTKFEKPKDLVDQATGLPLRFTYKEFMKGSRSHWTPLETSEEQKKRAAAARLERQKQARAAKKPQTQEVAAATA